MSANEMQDASSIQILFNHLFLYVRNIFCSILKNKTAEE